MCVGVLHDSPRIRRDARNPRRQAIRLRIVLRLPLVHKRFRRGQQRNRFAWGQALRQIAHRTAAVPDSGQIRDVHRQGEVLDHAASYRAGRHALRVRIRAASRWSGHFSRIQD